MEDNTAAKIQKLERRVDTLTTAAIIQGIALAYLLQVIPIVAIGFLFLLPILAFTHQYLPAFARECGRFLKFITRPVTSPPDAAPSTR